LVEDPLNVFHDRQGFLCCLFLSLLQREVAIVTFWKPALRMVLSQSHKEDRSKIWRWATFLVMYKQRAGSEAA
jgi:hypothetical protein